MDTIKNIVKQFYPLMMLLCSFIFVLGIFFSTPSNNGKDVFEGSGEIYSGMLDEKTVKNDGLLYLENAGISKIPSVKYVGGSQIEGGCVRFKELFDVKKEDGSIVRGSVEDDFAIYLMDIKTKGGIPASFVYDKENDLIYFPKKGIYTVQIKVYGNSGEQMTYEFQLPVEAM